jgi:hypothetical protein
VPSQRAALALLALVSVALALQARADGPGVLVGESARLHFLFDVEGRYDSLAGQGGIGANTTTPVFDPAEIILHFRPGLKLSAPGNKVDFEAAAALDWTRFTGWLNPTQELSYLGATAGATLEMGRGGPVSFLLGEQFNRSDRTTNPALGLGAITNANNLGARLTVRPGGGAIEAGAGYDFSLESYESYRPNTPGTPTDPNVDPTKFGQFGSQTHRLGLNARWRFLPKTAVTFDSSWALRVYDSQSTNISTKPLRAELGIAGLLTEKVRITLRGGWLKTFADAGNEFSGPVGELEVGWNPTETAGFTVGILRSAEPVSSAFGWYDDFRAYVSGRLALGGRLALTASASLDRIGFANAVAGGSARVDTQGSLQAALDMEMFRLLHAVLGGVVTTRNSTEGGFFTYARTEGYLKLVFNY